MFCSLSSLWDILTHNNMQESRKSFIFSRSVSALECVLCQMIPHTGQEPCNCLSIDPQRSFSSQLLTIPFLWQLFPHLKEVILSNLSLFRSMYILHLFIRESTVLISVMPVSLYSNILWMSVNQLLIISATVCEKAKVSCKTIVSILFRTFYK